MRWLPLLVIAVLGLGAVLTCQARQRPSPMGAGPEGADPPVTVPHPQIAALTRERFLIEAYQLHGVYPEGWEIPAGYEQASNSVLELSHGEAGHLTLGYLPGAVEQVRGAISQPVTAQELDTAILDFTAEGAIHAKTYFTGCAKTLLGSSALLFGDHEARIVTMRIERPVGLIERMPLEERAKFLAAQLHYLNLAPEGEPRLSRQYIWILGDDVWLAQLIAPPSAFHQRALEVEEVIIPSLEWGARPE